MKKFVFISYKAEDFDRAERIRQNLNSYGIDTWMAPKSISGGASYASEIPKAIHDCTAFLLVMTTNTQKSKWVPREIDQAINDNKPILPFYLEKCVLRDEFKFYLTNIQSYYQYENRYDEFERLMNRIADEFGIKIVYEGENRDEARELKRQKEEQAALEADAQTEKKKPIKPKKPKKEKTQKRKMTAIIIPALAVAALIALTVVINVMSTVKIGSTKHKKSETSLSISGVTFTQKDMQNLEKLNKLTRISLNDCTFETPDIGVILSKATKELTLVNCGVTDEMLEGKVNSATLEKIDLSKNTGVKSIDFLSSGAPNLYSLRISNTSVKDVSALPGCTQLKFLYADGLGLTEFSDLSGLSYLNTISVNNNKLSSLDFLKNCSKLEEVDANGNELTNLDALEKCLELIKIEAGKNSITDISGLKNTTLLNHVLLNHNSISDLSPLKNSAKSIKDLYLCDNNLTSLDALSALPELSCFNIDNNSVTDLSVLKASSKLWQISASHNELTSADFLSDKSKVCYADLSYNHLTSFVFDKDNGFATDESVNYLMLDVSHNEISRFLLYKTKFSSLNISSNPIECFRDVMSLTPSDNYAWLTTISVSNEFVLDYNDNIPFSEIKILGKSYILGCPLDKQVAINSALGGGTVFPDSFDNAGRYADDYVTGGSEWYYIDG